MLESDLKNFSRSIVNTETGDPTFLRIFLSCLSKWMDIQRQRFHVLILQRRLNNILMLYVKRRQNRLRFYEKLTNPKIYRLLEHIRSPHQFYKIFRVTLPAFLKIKETVYDSDSSLSNWIPEMELLLFLFWLSAGSSYKKVSKLLEIHESQLYDIFDKVSEKFSTKITSVIQFPKAKIDDLSEGFMKVASNRIFGLVLGYMDSYHIQICSDDIQYLNDAYYFSIQIQSLCDYKGAFMDIAVGFPGSMPKSQVIQCTPIYIESAIPPGYVFLSGSGYPCILQPLCLFPPFFKDDDPLKKRFNHCHEKIHSVMKKSVGQMFHRWRRIFSKPLSLPLPEVTSLIIVCSMIHNLCLEVNDIWPKETEVNFTVNREYNTVLENQVCGKNSRKQMAKCLLSDSEVKTIESSFTLYEV